MVFKKIIVEAVGSLNENKAVLARALLLPFLLIMIWNAINQLELNSLISIILAILSIAVNTVLAITTHRVVLLGPRAVSKWGLYKWSKRETTFAQYIMVFTLLMTLIVFPLSQVPVAGEAIGFILGCWIVSRLSLVFPAIAVNQEMSIKNSLDLTHRHQVLMFLILFIFPIVFYLQAYLQVYVQERFLILIPYTFLFANVLITFITVFEVAALSIAYKYICKEANVGEPITSGEA